MSSISSPDLNIKNTEKKDAINVSKFRVKVKA